MEGSLVPHALALLFILQLPTCLATRPLPTQTNTEFIKTSCSITTYPQLCYSSLSTYASKIQANPKTLATTALSTTLSAIRSTKILTSKLSKSRGLNPRVASALIDCIEELGDAVDQLQKSIQEMGQSENTHWGFQMNDVQTWVSSALTDEDTCMAGFAENGMGGSVKTTLRGYVVHVAHMTSNALALVNNFAST
ncbi:21 kDa protein-like [Actinidia eriantha]|uniref:21 kDa protein-like n=1 Tax=Actinidia eriantha TaxID=165200 RepID=UPI002587A842|nr:21 kDa protein-like [Actinidia eriantha]